MLGETSGCGVKVVSGESFFVQLLVLEAGPLLHVSVSMLAVASVVVGYSNNHERQLAALFVASEIHLKVMLYVASSRLYLLTLLLAFFCI